MEFFWSALYIHVCVRVLSRFSRVQLLATPWTSLPGSSVHGIVQARILQWVAVSSSRGSSQPRDLTCISCIVGRFFSAEPPEKPVYVCVYTHTYICIYAHTCVYMYMHVHPPPQSPPVALVVKHLPANAGDIRDAGLIPLLGRFPGGGPVNPLQYSCL